MNTDQTLTLSGNMMSIPFSVLKSPQGDAMPESNPVNAFVESLAAMVTQRVLDSLPKQQFSVSQLIEGDEFKGAVSDIICAACEDGPVRRGIEDIAEAVVEREINNRDLDDDSIERRIREIAKADIDSDSVIEIVRDALKDGDIEISVSIS